MGFIQNIIQNIKSKFKRDGSFKEAWVTWRISNAYLKKKDRKLARLLKKGKSHYNYIKFRENHGYSFLHQAITDNNKDIIELILDQKYSKDIINDDNNLLGLTPIHLVAISDNLELFKYFEEKGADLNLLTKLENLHLMHLTAHNGSLRILDYIFKKHFAQIIDIVSPENWSPLHYACFQNKMDISSYLVDNNANLYIRNKQQMTALDLAIFKDNFQIFQALHEFHYEKSKLDNFEHAEVNNKFLIRE